MKSLGRKPDGARLERIKASPRWAGGQFRNLNPILPGLRDPNVPMPSISDRRATSVVPGPLRSMRSAKRRSCVTVSSHRPGMGILRPADHDRTDRGPRSAWTCGSSW